MIDHIINAKQLLNTALLYKQGPQVKQFVRLALEELEKINENAGELLMQNELKSVIKKIVAEW